MESPDRRQAGRALVIGALVAVAAVAAALAAVSYSGRSAVEAALTIERPDPFISDLVRSEAIYEQQIGPSIGRRFIRGVQERDWELAASGLAENLRVRFPARADGARVPDHGVEIRDYAPDGLPVLDRDGFLAVLQEHTDGLAVIERARLKAFEHYAAVDESRSFLRGHLDLGGQRPDRTRMITRAVVKAEVTPDPAHDGEYLITKLAWEEGYRADATRPPFEDITDAVGLHYNWSEEKREHAQALIDARRTPNWGGLTVIDWNDNGYWDILASVAGRDAILFLNDGKGGFVRHEAPMTAPEESPYTTLYADLNNDGREELVSGHVLSYERGRARVALYRRTGETGDAWELLSDALEFEVERGIRDLSIQGIVPADVTGNGYLDLFFCVYDSSRSRGEGFNRIDADDGARNLLFINHGDLRFTEEAEARGISGTQYTYVARFLDVTDNGHLDIFEGNDFGPNRLWENQGDATFIERPEHPFAAGSSFSMGMTIADYDNTGAFAVHISNMFSHAGNRIVPLAAAELGEHMRERLMIMAAGNQQHERDPDTGEWVQVAAERGVNKADWAWACLFFDMDNDMEKDLLVVNGFTSHQDRTAPDY